jgi:nicotinamidase-related amidase
MRLGLTWNVAPMAALGVALLITTLPGAVRAQAVTDDWASAQIPVPAPPLKAVTLDPRTTALAVMDFNKEGCTTEKRPRCVADVPNIAKLLADARAHGVFVFHTLAGTTTAPDIVPALAPHPGEPVYGGAAGPDKFIGSPEDLQKVLNDHRIATVIACGTSANGAELYMASAAATRGFKVIVPVDAMPADTAFAEGFSVWEMAHAPGIISAGITLTRTSMISFGG